MNLPLRLASLILICLSIVSCKNDSKIPLPESKKEAQHPIDQTRYQIHLVTVNNLRVRQGSQKSTEVIDKLEENAIVYSYGEVSEQKEKIVLRNREFDEPYHRITYNGNTGWVYGGGLYKIYDKLEEDSFTESFESMVVQLCSPNKDLLEKGKYIMRALQLQSSGSEEWNDILYLIAEFQLNKLTSNEKLYRKIEERQWTEEEYKMAYEMNYDMKSNSFANEFRLAGMKFTANEGMIEPIVDPDMIATNIDGPFSEPMNQYIKIQKNESEKKLFDDGGISSPISKITSHIIEIENLVKLYPNFPRTKDLKRKLQYLHYVLINGSENTPALDFETKQIKTEWVDAWKQYLSSNPEGLIKDRIEKHLQKNK